jgi:hypothetical protein
MVARSGASQHVCEVPPKEGGAMAEQQIVAPGGVTVLDGVDSVSRIHCHQGRGLREPTPARGSGSGLVTPATHTAR